MITAEVFVRFSQGDRVVEVGLNSDQTLDEVWACAHRAPGMPVPARDASAHDLAVWSSAIAVWRAEQQLTEGA